MSVADILMTFSLEMHAYYRAFRDLFIPFVEQCADDGLTYAEVLILFRTIDAEMQDPLPHFVRFAIMLMDELSYPGAPPLTAE